jgi:hypothetical protein
MLNSFITPQKHNNTQKFTPATVMGRYLLWHFIIAKRENASHRVSMMAAICVKCDRDKYDHVTVKVLKTRICTAR